MDLRIDSKGDIRLRHDTKRRELWFAAALLAIGSIVFLVPPTSSVMLMSPGVLKWLWFGAFTVHALLNFADSYTAEQLETDRARGVLTLTKESIVRRRDFVYQLHEVRDVVIERCPEKRYYAKGGKMHRIWLCFASGMRIPVTSSFVMDEKKAASDGKETDDDDEQEEAHDLRQCCRRLKRFLREASGVDVDDDRPVEEDDDEDDEQEAGGEDDVEIIELPYSQLEGRYAFPTTTSFAATVRPKSE